MLVSQRSAYEQYWDMIISDKFDKFGTLFQILLFNKSILLPVSVCKIAG